ncbi:serine O-acetyltransferase [Ferroacidibacillus organovorans]|uniref:Serine acetyltransferase n=1 Tax=Ferroacidibacillus organovorans TaxID=1765683 RepID=A0A1V4EPP2_9BACL|nr:serine O-acetyltransferase [Ferroacidibacillus organovorans]OAG94783.1 serine acetyltransferase [Ferroacidibacillus organovorans]OPG14905.1 serine O-acetyltransferase [Ferroacidibacillus organovorans]
MLQGMKEDVDHVMQLDPAARSRFEVYMTYAGLHAVWLYRIAHALHVRGVTTLARVLSQIARFFTGIEIHPGAVIGKGLFIDHGDGVVIGETAVLGDYVIMYQGVTLGGTGKERGKRHPTIGNHVLIATGAKILGSITVGDYAKIGAGSVVLKPVPPNSTVVGIPARIVVIDGRRVDEMDQTNLPDPVSEQCEMLEDRIVKLERHITELESRLCKTQVKTLEEDSNVYSGV